MPSQVLIDAQNISYSVSRKKKLFNEISFQIKKNETIAITGPNGSGKTTLIRILMGFIKNYFGKIEHFGSKNYSYVPQNFEAPSYINLDVKSFLKFTDMKNTFFSFDEVVDLLNIKNLLSLNLQRISGGQLRKILIAKSLLGSDEIIFLDEPTCWLDQKSQEEFYLFIKRINQLSKMTIVIITHDKILLQNHFDQVICLEGEHVCFGID